ncbi:MAG: YibE/F family protein, partial [Actinomycetota bacterium]|nr:YibE/F family protein [Actinomycetota bacterium]
HGPDPNLGVALTHGHGHGHGHDGPVKPASEPVRRLLVLLLVPAALATVIGLILLYPFGDGPPTIPSQQPVNGAVTATAKSACAAGADPAEAATEDCIALTIRMTDGPLPGRSMVQVVSSSPTVPHFSVGDQIVLAWSGTEPTSPDSYQVVDFQRDGPLIWLAVLFAVAVILLGRWRGLAALVALGLTFVVLLAFVLPAILAGKDPLGVAIVGSCVVMFVVLYLTHGFSARTSTAVLGTLVSLGLIGLFSALFTGLTKLTGLDEETSNLIANLPNGVDVRGLLLAGMIIGALGVLDDVTVTQTSAVWELHAANPAMGASRLFRSAMRIGRDHVASAVNTLVLAYAGAALPLLLVFSLAGRSVGDILSTQSIATEVVRTLVGSIGLVASVPITTALAAAVASREVPARRPTA